MSRRPAGSGSIYQSSTGQWVAAIYDVTGRRIKRKRWTKEEAEAALGELLTEYTGRLGWAYETPKTYWRGERERPPRQTLSPRARWLVFERDGHRCVYCGATAQDDRLVIDHVIAIANGGTDDHDNLVTACDTCNAGKGAL